MVQPGPHLPLPESLYPGGALAEDPGLRNEDCHLGQVSDLLL